MADLAIYELNGGTYKLTAADAERRGATPVKAAKPSRNKARGAAANKTAEPAPAEEPADAPVDEPPAED